MRLKKKHPVLLKLPLFLSVETPNQDYIHSFWKLLTFGKKKILLHTICANLTEFFEKPQTIQISFLQIWKIGWLYRATDCPNSYKTILVVTMLVLIRIISRLWTICWIKQINWLILVKIIGIIQTLVLIIVILPLLQCLICGPLQN